MYGGILGVHVMPRHVSLSANYESGRCCFSSLVDRLHWLGFPVKIYRKSVRLVESVFIVYLFTVYLLNTIERIEYNRVLPTITYEVFTI